MFDGCMFESRRRLRLMELHCLLERGRTDLRMELRRLDPRVAEQASHRLEIAVLL